MYIFDLDGTLYEGTAHFDYYAALMKQELPAEWQRAFARDYEKMKRGEHAVKIGTAYDTEQDTILEVDPFTSRITAVKSWSGEELAWVRLKPRTAESDFESVAIGFAGERPVQLEIYDRLGQRTRLFLSEIELNPRLRDGDDHAAVLEGAGGVHPLALQVQLANADPLGEPRRREQRRGSFVQRERRCRRREGQIRAVAREHTGHDERHASSSVPTSRG